MTLSFDVETNAEMSSRQTNFCDGGTEHRPGKSAIAVTPQALRAKSLAEIFARVFTPFDMPPKKKHNKTERKFI